MRIGHRQRACLEFMIEFGGKWWNSELTRWVYDTRGGTERIMRSMVKHGLVVENVEDDEFEITELGRQVAQRKAVTSE